MLLSDRSHFSPKSPIDRSTLRSRNSLGLLPFPLSIPPVVTIEPSVPYLHELYDHHIRQMTFNNYNYQSATESHKRLQDLAIGDKVLIRVHPDRFPLRILKRLHTRRRGPYKVFEKVWSQHL